MYQAIQLSRNAGPIALERLACLMQPQKEPADMPKLPPKPCTKPGCKAYATQRSRCDEHQPPAWEGKGSGSSRGYGWDWSRKRKRVLRRDGYICKALIECNGLARATEVDHVVPKFEGGTDSDDNLQAICTPCHREKTRREALRGQGEVKK